MKVIMWDVDDVLNDLMRDWFRGYWLPKHPVCRVDYDGITANPPHELLGITKKEYLESLDSFRMEKFEELKPLPEIQEWFQLHGDKAEHIVVTSVPLIAARHSAGWVYSHFGHWIRSFNVVPSPRPGVTPDHGPKTKAEYIRTFSKVDIVVEDNPETLCSMQKLGFSIITIPRPWNESKATLSEALDGLTALMQK
jgi:hypothetical protein